MAYPPRKLELTPEEKLACAAVKKLRSELGMTLVQFARQLGCTPRSVMRWERCANVPGQQHLCRLSQLSELNERLDGAPKKKAKLLTDPLPEKQRVKRKPRFQTQAWYRAGIPKFIWQRMTPAERADTKKHEMAASRVLMEGYVTVGTGFMAVVLNDQQQQQPMEV